LRVPLLAKAAVAEAKRREVPDLKATSFEALAGRGAKALVNGKTVLVGGARLLTEAKVEAVPDVEKFASVWASEGKTVLYAVAKGRLLGAFAVEDQIRPESKEAVTNLHRLGIRVAMITGDSKTVADSVAHLREAGRIRLRWLTLTSNGAGSVEDALPPAGRRSEKKDNGEQYVVIARSASVSIVDCFSGGVHRWTDPQN
jgi:hypothetical protein